MSSPIGRPRPTACPRVARAVAAPVDAASVHPPHAAPDAAPHAAAHAAGRRAAAPRATALLAAALLPLLGACATVRQDQVGVKTTFGRISSGTLSPGAQFVVPGVNRVVRLPARTVNREVRLELPSREGLNIAAEVSILYRIRPEQAAQILTTGGVAYEDDVVIPVFRSAAADAAARFMAKDMYGGERAAIERQIQTLMQQSLTPRGFVVEQVLLKSIRLPADLAQAVEEKLAAEQRAEQMKFVLEREKSEAERKRIEAEGTRQAQEIIAGSLTPMVISFKSIEAFRELARSPNAKVIVTDGRTPYLIGPEQTGAAAPLPASGATGGDAGRGTRAAAARSGGR